MICSYSANAEKYERLLEDELIGEVHLLRVVLICYSHLNHLLEWEIALSLSMIKRRDFIERDGEELFYIIFFCTRNEETVP